MIIVAWAFALIAAAVHCLVFVWEALLIQRPRVHQGIFAVPAADVPAVRLWAFGVGFYNLFLGLGLIAGVVASIRGAETVGDTLIIYICLFMALSGVVLFIADRMGLGRERGSGVTGALGQTIPPLIALIAMMLAR